MFRLLQILATTLIVFSCVYAQNNTIRINEFMALVRRELGPWRAERGRD